MSFRDEVYPYRNNRTEFPSRLLRKVDTHFTTIVDVGRQEATTLGGERCEWTFNNGTRLERLLGMGTPAKVCNVRPQRVDKLILKILLRAWKRELSDRYLDRRSTETLCLRRFDSDAAAYDELRQNAPRGAVKFAYNELPAATVSNRPLFGNRLREDLDYNDYYSMLLYWNQLHCFSVIARISQMKALVGATGGGGAVHAGWEAANNWIVDNQSRPGTIYHALAHG